MGGGVESQQTSEGVTEDHESRMATPNWFDEKTIDWEVKKWSERVVSIRSDQQDTLFPIKGLRRGL